MIQPGPPRAQTVPASASDTAFFGHPKGLGYLSFAEAWERFSYYGMQTLLVLYMIHRLLLPGHVERVAGFAMLRGFLERASGPLSVQALASAVFGLYAGAVYVTPILGGLLADRVLGRTKTVIIGALLMAAGHFLMAFDVSFLIALACLVAGVGCFKGNIASQVGALYATGDLRRADAFQIYFLFINAGVIAAPLTAGTLGEVYGWHYGFAAAGVGMLISLVIYRLGRKWLPADGVLERAAAAAARKPRLTREERTAVILLLALLPVLAVGAVGNQEIFNAYLLWAPEHIDLVFFGRNMPTSWLITVDAVLSVSMLVGVLGFWRLWARRFTEPDEIAKVVIGEFISVLGLLMLAAAAYLSAGGHKAGVGWALAFHVINSIGFANVFPVGLALYARASPKALAATMLGFYYVHLFLANNLVGWLGGLLEKMPGTQFWLLHAGLIAGAGVLLLLARQLFGHVLAPADEP